jgi:hypothetical protein
MARKKEVSKHPALYLKELEYRKGRAVAGLKHTAEWGELDSDQKLFMALYVQKRDAKLAAEVSGKTLQWVYEQEETSGNFIELMRRARDMPGELATKLAQEALPYSVMKLVDLLDSDSEDIQLKAIKHLHHFVGMANPADGANVATFTNLSVQMFGGERGKTVTIADLQREIDEREARTFGHENGQVVDASTY